MHDGQAQALIAAVTAFAAGEDRIRAAALVGSWASGQQHARSDIDFMLVARKAQEWSAPVSWLGRLGLARAGFACRSAHTARYGVVLSAHLLLAPEAELEMTFADEAWACTEPVDLGTARVVRDGLRILVDKDDALAKLGAALRGG